MYGGGIEVRVWEVATGNIVLKFPVPDSHFTHPALAPDGRVLAVSNRDTIKLFDVPTGQVLLERKAFPTEASKLLFAPDGLTLASGFLDSTILLWDVAGATARQHRPLTSAELEASWSALVGENPAKAYTAARNLQDAGKDGGAFIGARLHPTIEAPAEKIRKLIGDLDGNTFVVRERAMNELQRLTDFAESALREALKNNPSPESTIRIKGLLEEPGKLWPGIGCESSGVFTCSKRSALRKRWPCWQLSPPAHPPPAKPARQKLPSNVSLTGRNKARSSVPPQLNAASSIPLKPRKPSPVCWSSNAPPPSATRSPLGIATPGRHPGTPVSHPEDDGCAGPPEQTRSLPQSPKASPSTPRSDESPPRARAKREVSSASLRNQLRNDPVHSVLIKRSAQVAGQMIAHPAEKGSPRLGDGTAVKDGSSGKPCRSKPAAFGRRRTRLDRIRGKLYDTER